MLIAAAYVCARLLPLLLQQAYCQQSATVTVGGLGSGSGSGSGDSIDALLPSGEAASSSEFSLLVPFTSSPAFSATQVQPVSTQSPSVSPLLPTPAPSLRLPLVLLLSESVPYEESEREHIIGTITASLASLFSVPQDRIRDVQLITQAGRRQSSSFNAISFSILSDDAQAQERLRRTVLAVQTQVCDLRPSLLVLALRDAQVHGVVGSFAGQTAGLASRCALHFNYTTPAITLYIAVRNELT